jgi:tRNA pseudouridine38-40 synthase
MYSFNYLLVIQYDGTGFAGWQRQTREKTIQGAISGRLQKLCGHKINLIGAGRTDAGAHAIGQVASFKTKKSLKPETIKRALNATLFPGIYIKHVREAPQKFHARYSAGKKLYRYIILREPSPFLYNYSYPYYGELSPGKMKKAAQYLKGEHNFRSFWDGQSSAGVRRRNPVRIIERITISNYLPPVFIPHPRGAGCCGKSPAVISVDVEGHSFLTHMVRIIAGTLVGAGRGVLSAVRVKEILEAKDRTLAGKTLPAKGLFLVKVYY